MTTAPQTKPDQGTDTGLPLLPPWSPTEAPGVGFDAPALTVIEGQQYRDLVRPAAHIDKVAWSPRKVRLTYLIAFVATGLPILALMAWLRATADPAQGTADEVVDALSLIWIILALPVVLNVVGALTFRNAGNPSDDPGPIDNKVCFRLVTRGTNVEAVLKSVHAVTAAMSQVPLFPYSVEVVTDRVLPLPLLDTVSAILVPDSYRTPNGTKFKARALQFAMEYSPVSDTTWLFHLDEETHVMPSVVRGIRDAIVDEEASGQLRIGQGVVLYHRDIAEHPFLTLADSVRTGDDLGRFRLQHRFGQTAFGMHGSFILVRNDVEKEVGFDFGPSGSVTEDAWWSLAEMANGRRSRWVDGYCLEQSTRSVADFVRQRRRWFIGLCMVCVRAPAMFWHRVALVSSVLVWGVGWLGWWGISIAAVVCDVRLPFPIFVIGFLSLTSYSALYILGLEMNLEQRGVPWYRRIVWHVMQVLLLPAFSILESSAVIYGVIRPDFNFHIVKK